MTLKIFILFCSLTTVCAEGISQPKVNVKFENQTLLDALIFLQRNTDYQFVYRKDLVENIKVQKLTLTNATINTVLDVILVKNGFAYEIVDNSIVVIKQDNRNRAAVQPKKEPLHGVVRDEKNQPLPGANVIVKGSHVGVTSDVNGKFQINVKTNDTLVFSYIGMIPQEIIYKNQKMLDVKLVEDNTKIDEIVVTGIFNKSKESYVGSYTAINRDEVKKYGSHKVLDAIRNIDPAFNIVENNAFGSNPNKLPEIQIRGNSSLPNVDIYSGDNLDLKQVQDDARAEMNMPLVIIDGFESTMQRLVDMNVDDVETITLLKDVSATSLYGSRGSNGVLVVYTRMPEPGKLKISYSGSIQIEAPDLSSYNLMNARQKLELEYEAGLYHPYASFEKDIPYLNFYNYRLNEINSGVDTYWLSKPVRTGIGQTHNMRLEGGDNAFRYSASLQYNDTKGAMKGSGRENFNGNIILSYNYKNIRLYNSTSVGFMGAIMKCT